MVDRKYIHTHSITSQAPDRGPSRSGAFPLLGGGIPPLGRAWAMTSPTHTPDVGGGDPRALALALFRRRGLAFTPAPCAPSQIESLSRWPEEFPGEDAGTMVIVRKALWMSLGVEVNLINWCKAQMDNRLSILRSLTEASGIFYYADGTRGELHRCAPL